MASGDAAGYGVWLCDLDGTLVDVERSYVHAVIDRVGDRLGCDFDDREAVQLWYGTDGVRRRRLAAHGVTVETFWETFEAVRDPAERVNATFLYGDAVRVGAIDAPVGLVTHCPEPITRDVLDALDLRDWFDAVVCCDHEIGWKPDPEPARRALSGLAGAGEPPSTAADGGRAPGVFVGASPVDVGAARSVGFDAVHVARHDPMLRGRCVLGDRRVSGFDDLVGA
jgi:phosphoglycolate phosphatase